MKTSFINYMALAALGLGVTALAACEQDTREDMQEETTEASEEVQDSFENDGPVEDSAEEFGNAAEETGDEMEEAAEDNSQ